jgi:hypothetical protein
MRSASQSIKAAIHDRRFATAIYRSVLSLIKTAQQKVNPATNQELIQLYWRVGKYISDRLSTSEWGQKTIEQLAAFIQTQEPGIS